MAKRDKDPRLQELFSAGKNVYSISKCNTIEECLFEAYNTYILHNKGTNGIYGILGTKIHDKLEEIINGKATVDELPTTLNEELLDLDMLGVEFPKDFKGNDTIRNNWVADMKHFCKTFQPPKGTFKTEQLVIYPLSGYICFVPAIYDFEVYKQYPDLLDNMCYEKLLVCDFCVVVTPEHIGKSTTNRIRQAIQLNKPVYIWANNGLNEEIKNEEDLLKYIKK